MLAALAALFLLPAGLQAQGVAGAGYLSLVPGEAHVGRDVALDQEDAVVAVVEAVFAATEARDYAALDTLYAEDATIVEGTGIDRGWAFYRDHHLKPELAKFEDFIYRPRNVEAQAGRDWAWALFEYDLKLRVEGRSVDRVGRGTVVLQRRDDRWVVRHMQTASRPREK